MVYVCSTVHADVLYNYTLYTAYRCINNAVCFLGIPITSYSQLYWMWYIYCVSNSDHHYYNSTEVSGTVYKLIIINNSYTGTMWSL